ncbi:MAG: tetratricopeptide repeat protein [Anaerolineales bacterium]
MRYKLNQSFSLKWMLMFAVILSLAFGLIQRITPVRADVAPPKAPPGANPDIGTVLTNVRMMDEKVIIDVQKETDNTEMGTARVWAEFHMENLGNTTEMLMVRFPSSYNDGFSGYPEIGDIMVYVNNISVSTSSLILEGDPENWDDPIKWVEFEVKFPPGEIVEIEVDYTLNGTGEYPFVSYAYLLETGAGWSGTIGSAEIIVRLPYPAIPGTVFIDSSPGWGGTTPGALLSGNEVRWYFEDFEPTYEHNISIAMVWPSVWHRVMQEQNQVWNFPDDGEAWGRLAKLYKEMSRLRRGTREDAGGFWLFNQSVEAYEQALTLLPDDALWHAGYADLLLWNSFWTYNSSEAGREMILQALDEIYTAYKLDSDQPLIQEIARQFPREAVAEENGEFVFYWLTQTPTLEESQSKTTATAESVPTATPLPEPTQPAPAVDRGEETGDEDSAGKKFLPICGSAILFPLALFVTIAAPKFRSKKGSLFTY